MKKILYIIFIIALSISCSSKHQKDRKTYYVISHPKKIIPSDPNEPPPPPPPPGRLFYGTDNFILLPNDRVFYFKQDIFVGCYDYYREIPPRINLIPSNIIEIKAKELKEFIILNLDSNKLLGINTFIFISYPTDSIRTKNFLIINDYLNKSKFRRYIVRNWTEEESFVINSILNKSVYDPTIVTFIKGFCADSIRGFMHNE